MSKKKYEILAPVGNMEMFEAALAAGADAVYLAGHKYGARNITYSFDLDKLSELIKKAHIYGLKVYITVNTLIKDKEMEDLYYYLIELYRLGVDAFIIQDLGVYNLIKKVLPDFELHASTQMAANSYYAGKYLEDLGFSRVVVGREMDRLEIKKIAAYTGLEIEAFVHGALCVSVSGRCLMSSLIGGRSGNRGKCAQACRKSYELFDKNMKRISLVADSFISSKDLCLIGDLDELLEMGVYSLKIEGRLKKPEYVYQVVKEYKKALEGSEYSEKSLSLVSNRRFTRGLTFEDFGESYYNKNKDKTGIIVGKVEKTKFPFVVLDERIYKGDTISFEGARAGRFNLTITRDYSRKEILDLKAYPDILEGSLAIKIFSEKIRRDLLQELKRKQKFPLDLYLTIKIGSFPKLSFKQGNFRAEVIGNSIIDQARNKPTSERDLEDKISRLGGTHYYLNNLKIDMDGGVFVPISHINNLRQRMISVLDSRHQKTIDLNFSQYREIYRDNKRDDLSFSLEVYGKVDKDLDLDFFSRIYIHDLAELSNLRKIYSKEIFFVSKRIMTTGDYEILDKQIQEYLDYIDGFSVNNLSDLYFFEKYKKNIHIESHFNIFNSQSIEFLNKRDIFDYSLSEELNIGEIKKLKTGNDRVEIVGYGQLVTMLTKYCPTSPLKKCKDSQACESCRFKRVYMANDQDRYEVIRYGNYSEILTVNKKNILDKLDELIDSNLSCMRIIDRGEDPIWQIIDGIRSKSKGLKEGKYYSGHFYKGVE